MLQVLTKLLKRRSKRSSRPFSSTCTVGVHRAPALETSRATPPSAGRILRELRRDGRISNAHLAENVGLSTSPCCTRMRHLEHQGVIEGYTVLRAMITTPSSASAPPLRICRKYWKPTCSRENTIT